MKNAMFLGFECIKVLNESNGQQFVFNARCFKDGQVYTDVGIGANIAEAKINAKQNLLDMMNTNSSLKQHYEQRYNNYNPDQTKTITNKSKLNGGGNKPISEGQINCLQNIALHKALNINDLCQQKYGKDLDQLVGSQANELIKSLTGGQ